MEIIAKVLDKTYPIIIGKGLIKNINRYYTFPKNVLIVYDENVGGEFLDDLVDNIMSDVKIYIAKGESSKNFDTYKDIVKVLTLNEFSRSDVIISLGGGATSDLCGFVAATYKRGINLILIPSTTLAMVDASIGGKNAIDFMGVKNNVGTFYLPNLVLIDENILNSLPNEVFNEGLVEALKCGLIKDVELFNLFKGNIKENITKIIAHSIEVKNYFVSKDFYDKNERRYLNFGHTLAHAIEAKTGFEARHSEAVAYGMVKMTNGKLKEDVKEILDKLDIKYDFNYDISDLRPFILQDKKIDGGLINLVMVDEIGKPYIKKVSIDELGD